jgi:hypothetical protein
LELVRRVAGYGCDEAATEATPRHPRAAFTTGLLIDQRVDFVRELIDLRNRDLEIMAKRGVRLS